MAIADRRHYFFCMLRRTAALLPRSAFTALAVALGLQVAATGFTPSSASSRQTQLAGHATAVCLPPASAPVTVELENGESGTESMRSRSSCIDDRPHSSSDVACTRVFTPWRANDALARAGRLSSPSTAPPLSGA